MKIEEFVSLTKARPAGPKKWLARCPVHSEKTGSLSIKEGKGAILLYCFGCHAKADKVMPALGLKVSDIFYNSSTKLTPEQREAYRREQGRKELEEKQRRKWIMAAVSQIAYPNERRYWSVVSEAWLIAWKHAERRHGSQEMRDNMRAQFVADVLRMSERKLDELEIGSPSWHQQLKVARRWCQEFNKGQKQRTEVYL